MSKEQHGFSVSVAIEVGVHCALLLQHLVFIQKATVKNGEDWRLNWVKRSAKSLQETYPYMTPKEIRGATERLERDGNIVSRIDNEMPGDRTKAFCCTKKGLDLMGIPFDKRANGVTKGQMPFDKRANDHLTKGQMLIKEGYSSFNLLVEEERATAAAENSNSTLKEKAKPQINSAPPDAAAIIELHDPETPGATIYDGVPSVPPPEFGRVNVEAEVNRLRNDAGAKETFSLVRKIPAAKYDDYLTAFSSEISTTGETYWKTSDFRRHFLNWSEKRYMIEKDRTPAVQRSSIAGLRRL